MKTPPEVAADLAALPYWIRCRTEIVADCIEWAGPMAGPDESQPRAWVPGESRQVTLSRYVYETANGATLHPARAVFRRCSNPRCIRLAHLALGETGQHRAPIVLEHEPRPANA